MIVEETLINIKRIPLLHPAKSTAAFSIQMLAHSLKPSPGLVLLLLNISSLSLRQSIDHAICRGTIGLLWFFPALQHTD